MITKPRKSRARRDYSVTGEYKNAKTIVIPMVEAKRRIMESLREQNKLS